MNAQAPFTRRIKRFSSPSWGGDRGGGAGRSTGRNVFQARPLNPWSPPSSFLPHEGGGRRVLALRGVAQ
jgi:hypothetical protein